LFVQIDEVASRAEFVPALWWQHLLHNQTSLLIKSAPGIRRFVGELTADSETSDWKATLTRTSGRRR
jgi:hypothetical protein